MKPTKINHSQGFLFQSRLSHILNPDHELRELSNHIDWSSLEEEFVAVFSSSRGAPVKPVRLVVGLLMLEHMYGVSDEAVVQQWVENPYWQLFCGYDYLQWEAPIDSSKIRP